MTDLPAEGETAAIEPDFHWRQIWLGFGLSLAITLVLGLPITAMSGTAWWLAWTGVAGLFISAAVVARRAGTGEPLNGAMLAVLYFAVVAVIYLVGQALEALPDPLPGLPADDSTFFFVWPLAQIVAGTLGSAVGGMRRRRSAE
ncbi:MAG: hypothetical protein ACE5HA_06135 [Anaerolineae bacterium]